MAGWRFDGVVWTIVHCVYPHHLPRNIRHLARSLYRLLELKQSLLVVNKTEHTRITLEYSKLRIEKKLLTSSRIYKWSWKTWSLKSANLCSAIFNSKTLKFFGKVKLGYMQHLCKFLTFYFCVLELKVFKLVLNKNLYLTSLAVVTNESLKFKVQWNYLEKIIWAVRKYMFDSVTFKSLTCNKMYLAVEFSKGSKKVASMCLTQQTENSQFPTPLNEFWSDGIASAIFFLIIQYILHSNAFNWQKQKNENVRNKKITKWN